jgi:hypothetical protein
LVWWHLLITDFQTRFISSYITYINYVSSIIAICLYFFCKRKSTGNFIILSYLIYSIATDFLITPTITGLTNNHVLGLRIFTVIEFVSFTLYINYNLKERKKKNYTLISIPIILIVAFIDYTINPLNQFDSLPSGVAAIIGITLCVYCLFLLIKESTTVFLYQISFFWILSGVFIFYSGTLFLFLLSQQNLDNPSFTITFVTINSAFLILRNILFSVAFTIEPPKCWRHELLLWILFS